MKKKIVHMYLVILRCILCLFYEKKYLSGKQFDMYHFSKGWRYARRWKYEQKIKGSNGNVPWPCNPDSFVVNPENIEFDIDYIDNFFNYGCYYQAVGKIKIGKRTQIAPNVGIITSNHNIYNIELHDEPKAVEIGDDCWIGMNSVILPGIHLGNHTIVGAGSVVTHSFPNGNCVIAGNPAKEIKKLEI